MCPSRHVTDLVWRAFCQKCHRGGENLYVIKHPQFRPSHHVLYHDSRRRRRGGKSSRSLVSRGTLQLATQQPYPVAYHGAQLACQQPHLPLSLVTMRPTLEGMMSWNTGLQGSCSSLVESPPSNRPAATSATPPSPTSSPALRRLVSRSAINKVNRYLSSKPQEQAISIPQEQVMFDSPSFHIEQAALPPSVGQRHEIKSKGLQVQENTEPLVTTTPVVSTTCSWGFLPSRPFFNADSTFTSQQMSLRSVTSTT